MSGRFKEMIKVPQEPAAKVLSQANVRLDTQISAPASASAEVVLEELQAKEEWIDILLLLSTLLPVRERVWWACLAARDYIGPKSRNDPPSLTAAEAWVFDPTEENREIARATLDHAYVDDDTVNCAVAVLYSDGTLGPGDLAEYPAPAGASELAAFAMNVVALGELSDKFDTHVQVLIDRALEIARGGSGNLKQAEAAEGGA